MRYRNRRFAGATGALLGISVVLAGAFTLGAGLGHTTVGNNSSDPCISLSDGYALAGNLAAGSIGLQ